MARCLQMMLRIDEYRFAFVGVDGISTLVRILSSRVNFQVSEQHWYKFRISLVFIPIIGTIPTGVLFVGLDLQSLAGHQNEQIHCHSNFG